MNENYYRKNSNKITKSRARLLSSFTPLILILIIGSIAGTFVIKNVNKESTDDNKYSKINQIIDSSQNNTVKNEDGNKESGDLKEENKDTSKNKPVEFDSTVAFIGDSRTQGLIMYNGLKEVQDYSYIGLMVDTAITKEFVQTQDGKKITLLQDMKNKNIKSVYIMLGLNELGWSYPQVFKIKYKELINEIKKIQPNCKIYIQSIIPMTKSKSDNDEIFNNKNVEKFNKLVKEVAKEENVTYLDVKSTLVDSQGYLPEEASMDGVHLDIDYCEKWLNYLKNNS